MADVKRPIVLATLNPGKVRELGRLLGDLRITLLSLREIAGASLPPETGATYVENALIKARAAVAHTGLPSVADDSGLAVDALNGMPGVFSARWSGRHGDDKANLELVLAQVVDVPDPLRGAAFVAAAALVLPDGREWTVEGEMRGRLVRAPRGSGGFGYDPIFVAAGQTRTNAELSPAEKDAISHRGKAFRALASLMTTVSV